MVESTQFSLWAEGHKCSDCHSQPPWAHSQRSEQDSNPGMIFTRKPLGPPPKGTGQCCPWTAAQSQPTPAALCPDMAFPSLPICKNNSTAIKLK